jgi:energy-coupling factor transport system permease protein
MFVYQPGNSLLHRSDAVSKSIWLIAITIAAVCFTSVPPALALAVLVAATVLTLGRIRPGQLLKRMLPFLITGIWLFVFFSVISNRDAPPLLQWGPLSASEESITYGAALGLRVITVGLASTGFVLTTEPRRLVNDLVHYGKLPYRGGFAIYAALRFIPQLQSEARTIRHAQAVRAATGSGPFRALFDLQRLTVPLLAGAIRRVQLTAVAMDSRAFGAFTTRTALDVQPRHPVGIAIAVLHVVIALVVIVLLIAGGNAIGVRAPIGGN